MCVYVDGGTREVFVPPSPQSSLNNILSNLPHFEGAYKNNNASIRDGIVRVFGEGKLSLREAIGILDDVKSILNDIALSVTLTTPTQQQFDAKGNSV